MKDHVEGVPILICVDCLSVLANGVETDEQEQAAARMGERWGDSRILLGSQVCRDYGCLDEDGDGCSAGFSWQPCNGCGSILGGDRFHATPWLTPGPKPDGVLLDAVAHADYPHSDGTLYDCPRCQAECFCKDGFQCVFCALLEEAHKPLDDRERS